LVKSIKNNNAQATAQIYSWYIEAIICFAEENFVIEKN